MPRMAPYHPGGRPLIAIVGEAPGEAEALLGEPFVGESGKELERMLAQAGIRLRDCYLTNVLWDRPPGNKIEEWCVGKRTADEVSTEPYSWPPIAGPGKYLHPERLCEVARLRDELDGIKPNLVLALGNTASWALLRSTGIGRIRGTVAESTLCPGLKVLPTYHPAGVLRNWSWRTIAIVDFVKAKAEAAFPEIRRPRREIWLEPTLDDLAAFGEYFIPGALISTDIETEKRHITCIGFAPTPTRAIVVPFWDKRKPDWHYWPTAREEALAWHWVRGVLQDPALPKVFQNGAYDLQYLWRVAGTPVCGVIEDTMLIAHALQPELPKDLGFLGSVHTAEPAWKLMRRRSDDETLKREE